MGGLDKSEVRGTMAGNRVLYGLWTSLMHIYVCVCTSPYIWDVKNVVTDYLTKPNSFNISPPIQQTT